ncbi:hypothetical protein [Mesorhizobium japonicum]|nr:hypothetical protein [Mesorhizobium japonicum]
MDEKVRFYPVFTGMPDDDYLSRWREHIGQTGRPEDFENVSTNKPTQLENIVLLSEEISVPVGRRPGGERVPCPFCATTSPKFIRGRMALFPDEKAVRFIGHRCAETHFGENFRHAERAFRRQTACRSYIDMWSEIGREESGLQVFVGQMSAVADDIQFARDQFDKQAKGFRTFLHRELAQTDGELFVNSDLGMTDRLGSTVIQKMSIGTAAGLRLLADGYDVALDMRQLKAALIDAAKPLPEWAPTSPEHPSTDEILRRGRFVERAMKHMVFALADVEDGTRFFARKNLALIHRWGNRPETPFSQFEMKLSDRQLLVRSDTFVGRHYANVIVPERVTSTDDLPPPPILQTITRKVA